MDDLHATLSFIKDAGDKLRSIRAGILVCRQDGPTAELEAQFNSILGLKAAAATLGLASVEEVLDALYHESHRIFTVGLPLSDAGSRCLLDLLAGAEAEVLQTGLAAEENPINVTDFVDRSFSFLRLDADPVTPLSGQTDNSGAGMEADAAADEFEIDAEMLEIFSLEADDLLGSIESNLNTLIANPADRSALWEIRRNAHTFKGAAGIVGLKKPSQLAHRIEDLLDHLAQHEIAADEKILNLLTASATCLREITGGDVSPAAMARLDTVYSLFDEVMKGLADPASGSANAPPTVGGNAAAAPQETGDLQPAPARPIVRVSIARLDELVRIVRDLVISRSVIEQRMWEFEQQIEELHANTRRLQATTAKIETDFEASMLGTQPVLPFGEQIAAHLGESGSASDADAFDSLELDRYTDFHQCARELTEAASDSFSINTALEAVKSSFDITFDDQRRLIEEMQEKVMQIRLIQFGSLTTRLQRAVRVACDEEENKLAEVTVENPETELDTDVLDSLVEPVMHLLRNAVVHGIEPTDTRRLLGKPETGNIRVSVSNEETHVVLRISDDGRGIAGSVLMEKAVSAGLIDAESSAGNIDGARILDLMCLPGLTTAGKLSMSAGRGVGMSIVKESIESRKGTISLETNAQIGTTFTIRIPLAFAVAQVLLVRSDRQTLAVPLKAVKHISEFSSADMRPGRGHDQVFEFASDTFPVRFLADHVNSVSKNRPEDDFSNTLLIETGDTRCALIVDEILKTEEVAIKPLGRPLDNLKGLLGAAILGSGEIVPILDLHVLLKNRRPEPDREPLVVEKRRLRVLVVDDSPSVRHMTSKVITGAGWDVLTAKDGLEAFEFLRAAEELPDVVLTDIEMPRMDGYELIATLNGDVQLRGLPVVLITSRSGEKHREKALEMGIADYLSKPYDDAELISMVKRLASKENTADHPVVLPAMPEIGDGEPQFMN